MNKKSYTELMDDLYEAISLLEMCQGYAQSDMPDMKALSESLYYVKRKYTELYESLTAYNKANT